MFQVVLPYLWIKVSPPKPLWLLLALSVSWTARTSPNFYVLRIQWGITHCVCGRVCAFSPSSTKFSEAFVQRAACSGCRGNPAGPGEESGENTDIQLWICTIVLTVVICLMWTLPIAFDSAKPEVSLQRQFEIFYFVFLSLYAFSGHECPFSLCYLGSGRPPVHQCLWSRRRDPAPGFATTSQPTSAGRSFHPSFFTYFSTASCTCDLCY